MKVIQANKFYRLKGGAERYMLELSQWLESEGHNALPFSMKHPDNLPTEFERYFVSFVQTQQVRRKGALHTLGRMTYSLQARRNMARLITDHRPDICHLHNIYGQISPSILHTLKEHRLPVVMTVHDHHLVSPQYNIWAEGCGADYRHIGILQSAFARYHKDSALASMAQTAVYRFHRWLKIYERNVDLFLCPSFYMKRQLVRGGFPEKKIRVNPYGIDVTDRQPTYEHKGYFLFVGRLSLEKGVETIIRVARSMPDTQFKIVGHGPDAPRLHRLADPLPNIEFLGFRTGEELWNLYAGATAVLVPSRVHENFPLAVLEAMSAGAPVIASEVGGIPEMIQDHQTGILVAPTDLGAWIEAIVRLSHHQEFQQTLARAARASVEKDFSLDEHRKRVLQHYHEALTAHR